LPEGQSPLLTGFRLVTGRAGGARVGVGEREARRRMVETARLLPAVLRVAVGARGGLHGAAVGVLVAAGAGGRQAEKAARQILRRLAAPHRGVDPVGPMAVAAGDPGVPAFELPAGARVVEIRLPLGEVDELELDAVVLG